MKPRRNETTGRPHIIRVNTDTGFWEKQLLPDDFDQIKTIDAEKITFIDGQTLPLLHPTDHAYNKRVFDAHPRPPQSVLPPLEGASKKDAPAATRSEKAI
jgi:hypothetical protein